MHVRKNIVMFIVLKRLVIFKTYPELFLSLPLSLIPLVIIILIQVFFRYGLNSALPWPDEAARFLMLWMTGLIAPSAYRWGGFVSIEMLFRFLPSKMVKIITLILLVISLLVLVRVNVGTLLSCMDICQLENGNSTLWLLR